MRYGFPFGLKKLKFSVFSKSRHFVIVIFRILRIILKITLLIAHWIKFSPNRTPKRGCSNEDLKSLCCYYIPWEGGLSKMMFRYQSEWGSIMLWWKKECWILKTQLLLSFLHLWCMQALQRLVTEFRAAFVYDYSGFRNSVIVVLTEYPKYGFENDIFIKQDSLHRGGLSETGKQSNLIERLNVRFRYTSQAHDFPAKTIPKTTYIPLWVNRKLWSVYHRKGNEDQWM